MTSGSQRILLTGHLGYVGPVAVRVLRAAGHHVTGLDNGFFAQTTDTLEPPTPPDREILRDVRDVTAADVAGIDAVVHLAGLSNDPLGALAAHLTPAINHAATIRLARLAREAGARRFVFASSCSLYGAGGGAAPLGETAPLEPLSAYARSKADCERDLLALAAEGGAMSPVFLRFATAFGASPRMRFDLVLNNLVAYARTTGEVRVMSDGTPWRPLVHIEDMAMAMACAVAAPREVVHARAFNVGRDDNNLTVAQIAEAVRAQVPGSRVVVTGETGGDPRSYRVDFARAHRELPGFRPRWTIPMGCAEVDAWITARGLTIDDVLSRRHVRLKQIRHLRETGEIDGDLRMAGVA